VLSAMKPRSLVNQVVKDGTEAAATYQCNSKAAQFNSRGRKHERTERPQLQLCLKNKQIILRKQQKQIKAVQKSSENKCSLLLAVIFC